MSVLIGVIHQEIVGTQLVGWTINKVGGHPEWLHDSQPSAIPLCSICGKMSSLVMQLYCPLGASPYHRCLYIWVCTGECSRKSMGWRVFRSMKLDSSYHSGTSQSKQVNLQYTQGDVWTDEQDDWGEGSDDWGEGSDDWDQSSAANEWGDGADTDGALKPEGDKATETVLGSRAMEIQNFEGNTASMSDNIASFTQLKISEESNQRTSEQSMKKDTTGAHLLPGASNSSTLQQQCGGTGEPEILEEDIGMADTERWNAMATLLNTKHEEATNSQTPEGKASSKSNSVVSFKPYYLYVVEEPEEETQISDHVTDLIQNYEKSEGKQLEKLLSERPKSSKGKGSSTEQYEKSDLKHGDKVFHKFLKRLQRCPEQCVRYERGGKPLLIRELANCNIQPCGFCGKERTYEFQLLPPLIPWLKSSDGLPVNVDFGTVLVFTCKANCWPSDLDPKSDLTVLEESIILQLDPDHHLYR